MSQDHEILTPAETSALVAMVGRGQGWPPKAALVLAIGAVEGGDWWTSAELAASTGYGPGTCRRWLAELEAEHVIRRDSGGGGRRYWCDVNPDWRHWDVTWRLSLPNVARQLSWIRDRQEQAALLRFIARPRHARYARISARLSTRDKRHRTTQASDLPRVPGTRGNGSEPDSYRASQNARYEERYRGSQERAVNPEPNGGGVADTFSSERSIDLSLEREQRERGPQPPPHAPADVDASQPAEGPVVIDGQLTVDGQAVVAAIEAATAHPVFGRLLGEVEALVTLAGGGPPVLAALGGLATHGLRPPAVVAALRRRLTATQGLHGGNGSGIGPGESARAGELRRLIARGEAELATLDRVTDDIAKLEAEQLRDQCAEWHNELATLTTKRQDITHG